MTFEKVFIILDTVVFAKIKRHLKDVEKFVLWGAWQGQTYDEMAEASNYHYTPNYLKKGVGPRLWRLISEVLREEICKTNFRAALERQVELRSQPQELGLGLTENELKVPTVNRYQDSTEAVKVFAQGGIRDLLVTGSADCTVKLWDVRTGECLNTLEGHTNQIWSVAFSPDGKTLASGSADCTVKLWDVASGQCLRTLHGHSSHVSTVAFCPHRSDLSVENPQILASGSDDETIKLWDTETGMCLKTLRYQKLYEGMNIMLRQEDGSVCLVRQ